jgi:uncharacterized membrane protein YqgA involved in biofilm formation
VIAACLNSLVILLGALVGAVTRRQIPVARQKQLQILLGVFLVLAGLVSTWSSLRGPFLKGLARAGVILLALMLGRFTGSLLGIQRLWNRAGRAASQALHRADQGEEVSFGDGFTACTTFFTLAPLAIVGPVLAGLTGNWQPMAAKCVMDGLAALGFARAFGGSAAASALPTFVWQGTWYLVARWLHPFLDQQSCVEPIAGVAGLLVFMVALVALGLGRIRLADYFPSLFYAPLLSWLFHA